MKGAHLFEGDENMKSFVAKPADVNRGWYILDATGVPLGRLSVQVARVLMGKHKPIYTPHVDTGDHVIVLNAAAVRLTGKKSLQKTYYRHTGYPGGLRETSFKEMIGKFPERVIEHAVRGMIPHTRLGRKMLKKLKVYGGADHPHEAQSPQPFPFRPERSI